MLVFASAIVTSWRVRCRSQVAGLLRNPDTIVEVWDEWLRYAPQPPLGRRWHISAQGRTKSGSFMIALKKELECYPASSTTKNYSEP